MGSVTQENLPENFSAPAETHDFEALLFDMDGTIIDSTNAIEQHWKKLGSEIGVSGDEILKSSHGRRSIDVLAILAPERANWEYVCFAEGQIPKLYGESAVEIPGSRRILAELENAGAPWAIVTSGTKPLVDGWLTVMGLVKPKFMVTAEDVNIGKPNPACYRKAAQLLGKTDAAGEEILVLEDAPAGVRAGKAAGYKVIALATTHAVSNLKEAGADWIVRDMLSVTFLKYDKKVRIEIRDALV